MGHYLRWSTCEGCGQKITQTISMGRWHPANGDRTSKTARCIDDMPHRPRPKKED
jgi:hypothetical protein